MVQDQAKKPVLHFDRRCLRFHEHRSRIVRVQNYGRPFSPSLLPVTHPPTRGYFSFPSANEISNSNNNNSNDNNFILYSGLARKLSEFYKVSETIAHLSCFSITTIIIMYFERLAVRPLS